MKRPVRIIYIGEAKEAYLNLKKVAAEERLKGIEDSENQRLLKSLKTKEELMKIKPEYGDHIPRKYLNKKIIEKYGTDSLWRIEIYDYWRAIYTLRGNKIEIFALILDIISHDDYNKVFNYRKR